MTIQIVSGYYTRKSVSRYKGQVSETAIKEHLASTRTRSASHWAYLTVNGRRVDDDRIASRLLKR